jgi:hypothetical protein
MSIGLLVAQSFWLAAPVAVAGILHMVVVKKDLFAALRVPIDGGRTLGGQPIFGPNKTWRGVAFMIIATALLGAAQGAALGAWAARSEAACLDFAAAGGGSLALGYAAVNAVLGLGYALGELPNSFLKRRIDIKPGKTGAGTLGVVFFLIDQADSVVYGLLLAWAFFPLGGAIVLCGIVCLTGLHLFLNFALWAVKIRRNV